MTENMMLLNLDDYVRVVQYTGSPIKGRYDGKDYSFPDGHDGEYLDVHKAVAHHILGFGNPDKDSAILRLGWMAGMNPMTHEDALKQITEMIQYHEVPPFSPSVVEFKRARDESAGRMGPTSAPMGQGGLSVADTPGMPPKDPFNKAARAK